MSSNNIHIHSVVIIMATVNAAPKLMKMNFFFSLKIFLITIFQVKVTLFQINLTFSTNTLLPDLGISLLIDCAGEIFNISLAPQRPAAEQKIDDSKAAITIFIGYI